MTLRKCEQKKCSYLGTTMCPVCPECNAPSNYIDKEETCVKCWNCEHDEGIIRGKPKTPTMEELFNKLLETELEEIEEPKKIIIEEKIR